MIPLRDYQTFFVLMLIFFFLNRSFIISNYAYLQRYMKFKPISKFHCYKCFTAMYVSLQNLNAELHLFTCTTCVINFWFNTSLKVRNQLSNFPYLKNFADELQASAKSSTIRNCNWPKKFNFFFILQISGEILSVPEYKSILLFPHPADNVTVTTNSSLAANIPNGTSGTCSRKDGWTHSNMYLLATLSFLSLPYVSEIAFR